MHPDQLISRSLSSQTNDRPIRHLNQIDLARRWNISPRTLERWRWLKTGPEYLKIGGHVVYRLDDIERYETGQAKNPGTGRA
jgi:hypothetical protein